MYKRQTLIGGILVLSVGYYSYRWDTTLIGGILVDDDDDDDDDRHTLDPNPLLALRTQEKNTA